ncbi:MAG: HlyC/CorC family transporter [Candidatus Omnitrophica bacterium]|nr:HlyC/CorC family transporter [Candidatus Omnitrophota bacterium]
MITLYIFLIIGAIVFQAFFTASEMAFTSVNKIKLKHLSVTGNKYAVKADKFLKKEGMYLGATLVGTNLTVIISSVLAARVCAEYFSVTMSPFIATAIMVPVTLVFAEIVPKMIARESSTEFVLKAVKPLSFFLKMFYPIVVIVNWAAKVLLFPFVKKGTGWNLTFTKNDLKKILLLGYETGEIEADEVELIHKVLDFGSKKVEKFMIPLYRVSSVEKSDTISNLKGLISLTGFSRVPVYDENKNNIVGIANIYDILFNVDDEKKLITDFMREVVHIASADGLDIALARLRHKKQPMGVVLNEKSEAIGIITIEDILEEIVGELEDAG